jgi:hypothetical protein
MDGASCTGTVVAPKYVLTAAHCIGHDRQGGVKVAANTSSITSWRNDWHTAKAAYVAPGWRSGRRWENDIAIVELKEPIDVAPIPINYDAHAAGAIRNVRMVGFGQNATNGTSGTKRVANVPVHPTASFFEAVPGNGACYGDSGGPSLAVIDGVEKVVAVTSHGLDDRCEDGGRVVRTDIHRAFLARFLDDVPAAKPPINQPPPVATQPPPPVQPPINQPPVGNPAAPIECSGSEQITIVARTIVTTNGPAIRVSGSCQVTLMAVTVQGPIGIEASGSAQVTVMGGSIDATSNAVTMTGSSQVTLMGTELPGSRAIGSATVMGS